MQECQTPEDISLNEQQSSSKLINPKYTNNQFYPKSRSKSKQPQPPQIQKLHAINRSSFSQTIPIPQSYESQQPQEKRQSQQRKRRPSAQNHPSFTMKIIDHHIRTRQSNLIGKQSINLGITSNSNSPQKVRSRLYEEIQQINKEQRFKPPYYDNSQTSMQNISERVRAKRKQSLTNNLKQAVIQEDPMSQLYKSLPQPFINKKQLTSYEQPVNYFKSRQGSVNPFQKNKSLIQKEKQNQLKLLEINNVKDTNHQSISEMIEQLTKFSSDVNNIIQSSINRKNKYKKKKLQPLKVNVYKQKMSNNIKDYLSVERIKIKQMQNHLLSQTVNNLNQNDNNSQNPETNTNSVKPVSRKTHTKPYNTVGTLSEHRSKPVKFNPPFPLYYYRDFVWKVGFSNEMIVQSPPDYETKVKVYLGKGNNSNLIRGLIKRRPWYQITEKYQQAHFVWTQIKLQQYFSFQKKSQKQIQFQTIQSPLLQSLSTQKPNQSSILNDLQKLKFHTYFTRNLQKQSKFKQTLKPRSKLLNIKQIPVTQLMTTKIHNHFQNNYVIGNKKALFSLMSQYYTGIGVDVFNHLPLTFHIKNGLEDDEYLKFLQYFYSISKEIKKMEEKELNGYIYKHNAWIVKPGQNTNRGNGIIVCLTLNQIKAILKKKEKHNDGTYKTYILQKYIQKPLLYKRRKFDLRHYMMMSCTNGIVKGYWYKEGYVRTTSAQYTLKFSSGSVHLTNDAVQKQLPDYGKFEKGNKISYEELNDYIKKSDPDFDFQAIILTKMKKIATDLIRASAKLMDPQKRQNNFEIFGLDFMIDQAYNVWLIECNSNPCLELSCPLLGRIIPKMVENTFRICLDPVFVPPLNFQPKSQEYYENINDENRFELVYDQRMDQRIKQKGDNNELLENKEFQQDDDTFDDDGEAWDD